MKDFLKKIISDKNSKISEIRSKIDASQSVDEVRSLTAEAEALRAEVREAEAQLAELEASEKRSIPANATLVNGDVVGSFKAPEARNSRVQKCVHGLCSVR